MERALGADFGGVRVHTDERADALNRSLRARAFTTGADIFFRRGAYDPASPGGREVLAHELTHVVQQQGMPAGMVVQRDPVEGEDGNFTDPNIPGATLVRTGTTNSRGHIEYTILETGETFFFSERTKTYSRSGAPIDPATLVPPVAQPVKKKKKPKVKSKKSKKRKERPEEPVEQQARKKKQRTDDYDPYFSEMSESEDDDTAVLTDEQKFSKLETYGALKYEALKGLILPQLGKDFDFTNPRHRQGYAARRTSKDPLVDIDRTLRARIGRQQLTLQHGRGHFVTPGKNKATRPESMAEPPAEYHRMFPDLRDLGKDPNAEELLESLADAPETVGKLLSDRQVSAMIMHGMRTPFDADLERSQLTEHLGKLLGIFTSETARAFEAEHPYDATLLIKAALQRVIEDKSTRTLKDMFYTGTGGSTSIFLGAPSEEHSPSGIGGAAQLRDPRGHPDAFKRQMRIFPSKKREFKTFVNSLKTGGTTKLPKQTEDDVKEAKKVAKAEQVEQAAELLRKANALRAPTRVEEMNDFLNNKKKSPLHQLRSAIARLRTKAKGNEAALAKLDEAVLALNRTVEATGMV